MSRPEPIESLLAQLDLEELDVNLYRGWNPAERHNRRVFGGLVAAQALRAATLTVGAEHHPHSLHGYFLRSGEPGRPIVFHVDRIRDGRSFTTRRVVAVQYGEAIFNLTASFQKVEDDPSDYQLPARPDVDHPDDVADPEPRDKFHAAMLAGSPFQIKDLGPTKPDAGGVYESTRRAWMKAKGPLGNDPLIHTCALTYATDMGAVIAAVVPVSGERWQNAFGELMTASLDHAVWFHRPIRADEWHLYDIHAVTNQNSRGLVRGTIHHQDGTLVASVTQEALIRRLHPPNAPEELG